MHESHQRHLLLNADIVGYSTGLPARQADDQAMLRDVLTRAAASARLDHEAWQVQSSGDGVLAVLPAAPAAEEEPRLVDDFVRHLSRLLRAHNVGRDAADRTRVRLGIHFGSLSEGANGYVGKSPIVVGRLVDAAPVKAAMTAAPDALLGLIVSDDVYQHAVATGHTTWEPQEFREVDVTVKTYRGTAWLLVSGADVHALDLGESAADDRTTAQQRTTTVINGSVRMGDHGVIGIANR
ncbi:hypothetical protein ITP53_23425 [Nonomuraea sp. K274]|uniref:Guanylate cyclase domain-containing protein n=1 Tax=Nonomuraea cypriaca TaxID=1187855 RepID=A0A931AEC0_9ACTN|nr:hypothetical protein [Nonomuraea cypriaca]MBF8188624.1 hypothetical protein [Nonomuraea cypriaca]